jgi:hypothetical protein
MQATQAASFKCAKCSAKYPWNSEIVGRVAKCGCGAVLKVPAAPEAGPARVAAQRRESETGDGPGRRPTGGMMVDQGTALDRLVARADADELSEEVEAELAGLAQYGERETTIAVYDDARDRKVPVALLAVGGLLMLAQVIVQTVRYQAPVVGSIIGNLLSVAINVVLMLVGVVIASKFGGINFGPVKPALLKLTGIFIGPIVLGELVTQALGGDPAVAVLGNACAIVACWFLIYYLFALDGQQTMVCVIAIGVVRFAVVTFIIGMIPFAVGNPREIAFEEPEHPDQEQLDQAITELDAQIEIDDDF